MILHTVNKSPHHSTCLQDCLALCNEGDSVLLIEDAVYAAVTAGTLLQDTPVPVYVLQADIEARGLASRLAAGITPVDDAGFVQLATEHDKVMSWY